MKAPPLDVVPLYTGDLCPPFVYARVSDRVCICKLYTHNSAVYARAHVYVYICGRTHDSLVFVFVHT